MFVNYVDLEVEQCESSPHGDCILMKVLSTDPLEPHILFYVRFPLP